MICKICGKTFYVPSCYLTRRGGTGGQCCSPACGHTSTSVVMRGRKRYGPRRGRITIERRNYTSAFNGDFRLAILTRDSYICTICGAQCGHSQKESLEKPCPFVHHANYNKRDTRPDNCITVCGSCHSKIHHNEAKYLDLCISIARQCALRSQEVEGAT